MKSFYKIMVLIVLLVSVLIIFSNKIEATDYVRLNDSDSIVIDKFLACRNVSNSGDDIFIPLKTVTEWAQFRIHAPADINFVTCPFLNRHELDCFWAANKTICETNLFWSDGKLNNYQEEHEAAFKIGGCDDGHNVTVLDTFTGLCFTRDWYIRGATLNWTNAMNFCDNLALCDDGTWDGSETTLGTCSGKTIENDNWVLPTKRELLRAVDYDRTSAPLIIGGNNNISQNVQSGYYWTSSRNTASRAWFVTLSNGLVRSFDVTGIIRVVCVSRN
jgi:hypothetical protein